MPPRIVLDLRLVITKPAFLVGQSAIDQLFQLLGSERFELKNLRARNERTIHVKKRIVCGGADQTQISAFYIRQQNILLRFVEMMYLVDKDYRVFAGCAVTVRGRGDY